MSTNRSALILLRGGGDLASGIALRLHRAGLNVVITELAQPLAVRRAVSFAEAIYAGHHTVEEVIARLVEPHQIWERLDRREIPVLVDPDAHILKMDSLPFLVVIDARLIKRPPAALPGAIPLFIGVGPGFDAGQTCDAVIETRRSHTLGRVYWTGATQPDSGQPEGDRRRVLRAPSNGVLSTHAKIGDHLEEGQEIGVIVDSSSGRHPIVSPFKSVLRGLIKDGIPLTEGLKIGDVDPRDDPAACFLVSDKALSIGGAALEAILTRAEIRERLWNHSGVNDSSR